MATIAAAGVHACAPVDGPRINLRDLAQVEARFAAGDPAFEVGFSPEPGSRRVFFPAELAQISMRAGIIAEQSNAEQSNGAAMQPICVERRSHILKADDFVAAIRIWAPEKSSIEITEWGRAPVPYGEVVVPSPMVTSRNGKDAVLLHGYVRFDGQRRAPIWVRGRITVRREVLVARQTIESGTRSMPAQFQVEPRDLVNDWNAPEVSLEQIAGTVAKRRIAEGAAVSLADLRPRLPVEPGSSVTVEVRDGAARLQFEARAETGGNVGDKVTLRNETSGKPFTARVTGENTVFVTPRGADPDIIK